MIGMGICGVLYGLSTQVGVAILLVTISGFFNAPSSIARSVLLQRNTPREMRGRVFSAFYVMRDVIFLIGMAGAGPGRRRRHPAPDRRRRRRCCSCRRPSRSSLPGLGVSTWGAAAARLRGATAGAGARAQRRSGPRRWPTSTAWPAGSARSAGCRPSSARPSSATATVREVAGRHAHRRARRRGVVRVLHPRRLDDGRHPGRRRLPRACRR